MLASAQFDSKCLLTTVMCGDSRLPERFRSTALVSLGSRMRFRMMIQPYSPRELLEYLEHALQQAAAPHLMTSGLKQTIVEHAGGNIRVLNNMAAELLATAAQKELAQMDEKLFLQVFSPQTSIRNRRKAKNNSQKGETNE